MRLAAIDIGSNTVGLVVAEVGLSLTRVRYVQSHVIGLGADVAKNFSISEPQWMEVTTAVQQFIQQAGEDMASSTILFGTAAMRNAADGDVLAMLLSRACGVECHVLGEDSEARFAFDGATSEFGYADRTLVIDLGGASTECVVGSEGAVDAWTSLPIGAGVAASSFFTGDPPTPADLAKFRSHLSENLAGLPVWGQEHALLTGGTALHLRRLLGDEDDRSLDAAKIEMCRQKLHSSSSAVVAAAYNIEPARARVLQAGVEIVDAVMNHLQLENLEIAVYGVNDGAILAYLADPTGWWETHSHVV